MACNIASRRRLRVLAQCKAEKRKMGPAYLRELEGVVYRHATTATTGSGSGVPHLRPSEFALGSDDDPMTMATIAPTKAKEPQPQPPHIALLVSESAFTRNCLLAAHASPLPFLLVHLPPSPSSSSSSSTAGGAIGAVFGNPALVSANGVLGGELDIRWEHGGGGGDVPPSSSSSPGVVVGSSGRPRLWWQGQPLPSWTPDADSTVVA